jgi:hypothetical protein
MKMREVKHGTRKHHGRNELRNTIRWVERRVLAWLRDRNELQYCIDPDPVSRTISVTIGRKSCALSEIQKGEIQAFFQTLRKYPKLALQRVINSAKVMIQKFLVPQHVALQ